MSGRPGHPLLRILGSAVSAVVVLLILISLGSWLWYRANTPAIVEPAPAPLPILSTPIPDGPQAGTLRRGRYLAIAGDCVSCHTRAQGRPFTGGLGLRTPFGVVYSANISGDRAGIGGWTPDQFYRALHQGVDDDGDNLYPAFPYTHFTLVTRQDSDAILAYLKTVPGDASRPPANRLPFPLNIRPILKFWNALFFRAETFHADPKQSPAWNRGAYLVRGLEHCGACHTPKNTLGADEQDRRFHGGELDRWYAPDLTGADRIGLGRWSVGDVVEYLRTGRNAHSNAAGSMAEVVSYSTSQLSDDDLRAIATYIKSLPASTAAEATQAADPVAMATGAAIYSDACAACHRADGKGAARLFPPLPGSAVVQQPNTTDVLHLILAGARTGPTPTRPSAQSMPSFAWKLDDQQVADVATYVRNAWGNRAAPVSAQQAAAMRKRLGLRHPLAPGTS